MQQLTATHNLTALQQQHSYSLPKATKVNAITRFLNWSDAQEENRFLWLGVAFMGNMGLVLPMTLVAVLLGSGNNLILWIATCVANVPVLIFNLAAQPTKVTLPILFSAWTINLVIILCSLVMMVS